MLRGRKRIERVTMQMDKALVLLCYAALTAAIWAADYMTTDRISLFIVSLVPIFGVAWMNSRATALIFAGACSVARFTMLQLTLGETDRSWIVLPQSLIESSLFFSCAWAVSALRSLHDAQAASNAELARLNQMKTLFLSMASHDLRNPLSAVVLGADGIREDAAEGIVDAAELKRTADQILGAATRMRIMLDNYLDYGRIETGLMTPVLREERLSEWAERASEPLQSAARSSGQTLQVTCHDDGMPRRFDPEMMELVLMNLVSNAIKFSPAGSAASVTVEGRGAGFRILVEDEGPGLGDSREELFEMFRRGSSAPQRHQKSTGLGLYIVREAIRAHGGEVRAENRVPRGTRFEVSVPRPQD